MQVLSSRLLQEYELARQESDRLFHVLKDGALYQRPIAERHRVVFYLGHLDCFDFIHICREGMGQKSLNATFDSLFQAGIDPDSSQLPSDKPSDWPSLETVQEYVQNCRHRVDQSMDEAPEDALQLALEHRLMHLETLAYMFHNFPYHQKRIADAQSSEPPSTKNVDRLSEWRQIPAGEALLGRNKAEGFGWDNEFDQHSVSVPAFSIQRYPVTNGQYLEFVKNGDAPLPNFWIERNGNFFYRGMFNEVTLPLDWPVYVTQREAQAYAHAHGFSVASEAQYHRAAYGTNGPKSRTYPWGDTTPKSTFGNFDFRRWDPESVFATPQGNSFFGVAQLVGNGWEWTSTPFHPFPGFVPRASYPGYSANFFDGEHFVMKGAASRTAARLTRSSFRNWFRRDYPYMYAKFRCVQN
jgi:formylglycine-generating enzyme required for sulfatase activity